MTDKEKQLVDSIAVACQELGWSIAIASSEENEDNLDGLIIGTEEYIGNILMQLDENSDVEFENGDEFDEFFVKKDDKKETVH